MNKMRRSLAVAALVAALSVPLLQGVGAGSLASITSSHHVGSTSASLVAGKSTKPVALKIHPPCPVPLGDC